MQEGENGGQDTINDAWQREMKPANFEYARPRSLDEAVELLAALNERYSGDAKVLAGGQSLVPMMNFRLARPPALVDINEIADLRWHRVENGILALGSLCRHRDVELDRQVLSACHALAQAVPLIGHPAVRVRGTVAGSLAHGDPLAEWAALAILLNGVVTVRSKDGERRVPAEGWFRSYFETGAGPDEIVVRVEFAMPSPRAGTAFLETSRRHGDFAIVSAAALVEVDANCVITDARLVLGGLGPVPLTPPNLKDMVIGKAATGESWDDACALVRASPDVPADVHASAEYRRQVGGIMSGRVLRCATIRATKAVGNGS